MNIFSQLKDLGFVINKRDEYTETASNHYNLFFKDANSISLHIAYFPYSKFYRIDAFHTDPDLKSSKLCSEAWSHENFESNLKEVLTPWIDNEQCKNDVEKVFKRMA